jgi:hypothetical protein
MTKGSLRSRAGRPALKDARGVLNEKSGDKPFRQRWADYKKEEKALEEAKYSRLRLRKVCAAHISPSA